MNNLRNLALWIVIALLLVFLFNLFQGTSPHPAATQISYSKFNEDVLSGQVRKVTFQGDKVTGELTSGQAFTTTVPNNDSTLWPTLKEHSVDTSVVPADENVPWFLNLLVNWFPMLAIFGVWIFFLRQMQSGGGKAMGFGKSRAKLLTERSGRVTFEDVAGVDEAKDDLKEIVDFLRDPQKFQRLGGRIPKGVLLVGPPGTGKTLLARAIAGEANVPFFTISGSDFVEMFVGVGASRVRDMFEQAKKNSPCIVFIDEIDAVGRHRGAGLGGGNDEREQTLNQLLVEMDGFEANESVILIAATNRPDVLDPALLRPGRFDRHVVVPNPDLAGREKILRVHLRKVPLAPDVDPRVIARGTPGFSGADLANLVNEGALLAARRGKRVVTMGELEDAKDKVMMGAERRSMAMSDEEKKLTAFHEGGHAIVALNVTGSDPIHKATIIPRGRALGMVMRLPERDQLSLTRQKMLADLCVAFGGRIAEELVFGHDKVTTGAQSDIEQATRMARAMVTRFGMSDELGPIAYAENQEEVFLGHSVSRTQNVSEATAQKIDAEIHRIIDECYAKARKILTDNINDLNVLARGLLEYETLTGDEIIALLKGIPPVRTPYEEPTLPARNEGPSVPAAGKPRPSTGPGPIISPEPQPR
ncbi:MAG TPA: ATP-dependent zinc metalloprotease FtsH [Rhizomicrobium sp.]|nr:ATP-dependent zinc metalloprotease FtsH [Rhizomicrobium sp.]